MVHVDKPGDFSTYTLRLAMDDARQTDSHSGFDPRYAACEFSFKASCPSDLDCAPERGCVPPSFERPEINYLAKDYASFRS